MKILSTRQIRELDAYTIENEPIASIDLMERASEAFTEWFVQYYDESHPVYVVCGPGNNGGDGLAVARLLEKRFYAVQVYVLLFGDKTSDDFQVNLKRLQTSTDVPILHLNEADDLPVFNKNTIIIDAILGSGLTRPVEGFIEKAIQHLNQQEAKRISIDIPSGLFADKHTGKNTSIEAERTCCFELPKLAFMFPENYDRVGDWAFTPIGLDAQHIAELDSGFYYIDEIFVKNITKKRKKYDHKGTYGHALLIMGSRGMTGAALLAARACLRSGAGLVTLHAPKCLENLLPIALPEAIYSGDGHPDYFTKTPKIKTYRSIGVGCGLGTSQETQKALHQLLDKHDQAMVLDADALNILARNKAWLKLIPKGSILTPHPKEFERLFNIQLNDFERNMQQVVMSEKHGVFIILKGAHTCITTPEGHTYFNSTGNPGMATAGSGDVLAGMLTGLLARGYTPYEASILGVYVHGLAGDMAASETGEESLIAGDIINHIKTAFNVLI